MESTFKPDGHGNIEVCPKPLDMKWALHEMLQKEVARVVEEEAAEAGRRTERRVRQMGAQIAATIVNRMSIEAFGPNQMKIILDFKNTQS